MNNLKRSWISLSLVAVVIVCVFLIPSEARMGLLGLFTTKTMGVALGILIAHYTRIFKFPYMDMSKMITENQWSGVIFLTVWYGVIIWAFSMGG